MEALLTPVLAVVERTSGYGSVLYQATDGSNSGMGWPEATFIAVIVAFGCMVAAVIIWQVFLTARRSIDAKANTEHLEEMRALTQRSIAANESTANEVARLSQGVTDLRVRLESVEKMLREVE